MVKLGTIGVVFLCVFVWKTHSYEFKVTVPHFLVISVGEPAVLPCTFSLGNDWQPDSIVITWQRGLEVVHSYYYSQDQLKRQSGHYVGRTSLFHSEMQKGNASLRLDKVAVEDMGEYICSVSSHLGSERKSFPVKVAALYSEPVLQFSVRSGNVELLLTSGGGFPAPTLSWLQGDEDLTNSTKTSFTQDADSGLYTVTSVLSVTASSNASTLNFVLRNEELMQDIQRNITVFIENEDIANPSSGSLTYRDRVIPVCLVLVLFFITGLIGLLLYRRKKHKAYTETKQKSQPIQC